jgi:hypothetical protein
MLAASQRCMVAQVENHRKKPMSTERVFVIVAVALVARMAFAEPAASPTPADQPTLASLNLSCSDFKRNENGSWSPVHAVTITAEDGTGVKMGPSTSFGGRTVFGKVRLAAVLKKECTSH